MSNQTIPSTSDLKDELNRERKKKEYRSILRSTIYILLAVAAIAVLIATLFLPVMQVTGTSMEPNLESGQIVLAIKNTSFQPGDIIAFYYNNKILLKRAIGVSGDMIDIKTDGTVYVNGEKLEEPYLTEKSFGQCDLDLPYQVPDGKIFVLGDHRSTSIDSRFNSVGCISDEFIVGNIVFRVWPLNKIGTI